MVELSQDRTEQEVLQELLTLPHGLLLADWGESRLRKASGTGSLPDEEDSACLLHRPYSCHHHHLGLESTDGRHVEVCMQLLEMTGYEQSHLHQVGRRPSWWMDASAWPSSRRSSFWASVSPFVNRAAWLSEVLPFYDIGFQDRECKHKSRGMFVCKCLFWWGKVDRKGRPRERGNQVSWSGGHLPVRRLCLYSAASATLTNKLGWKGERESPPLTFTRLPN